jgi:hypothetical protein
MREDWRALEKETITSGLERITGCFEHLQMERRLLGGAFPMLTLLASAP